MTMEQESKVTVAISSEKEAKKLFSGMTSSELAKAVFTSDVPSKIIRSLPAQTLYMAIQAHGYEASQELIAIASKEQYQLILDFEIWNRDQFSEERLWHWLSLIDEPNSLEPLARFIDVIDHKLLSSLVCKYVDAHVNEEPTEPPLHANAYTPDNGYTWIYLKTGDEDHNRLFGRILAFLFDTNPDYFYRLLYMPNVGTPSEFEEEAYEDMTKRLGSEGIPDHKTSFDYNSPMSPDSAKALLLKETEDIMYHVQAPYPIPNDGQALQPLTSLITAISTKSEEIGIILEQELTAITNAGIVFFHVEFSDYDAVQMLIKQIRGAINIGLERAMQLASLDLPRYYEILGFQGLYKLGLFEIRILRTFSLNALQKVDESKLEQATTLCLTNAALAFPAKPVFLDQDLTHSTELSVALKPFETLAELHQVKDHLASELGLN